jgi:hypothetical protein
MPPAPSIFFISNSSLFATTLLFNLVLFLLVRTALVLHAEIRRGPKPNLSLAQHLVIPRYSSIRLVPSGPNCLSVFHAVIRRVPRLNLLRTGSKATNGMSVSHLSFRFDL